MLTRALESNAYVYEYASALFAFAFLAFETSAGKELWLRDKEKREKLGVLQNSGGGGRSASRYIL